MTLSVQFLTIITMTLGGFYLGMAVDTFRRFKSHWNDKPIFVYSIEISFWLSQTFILYYLLFLANSGELRVYVFLACLFGFATYQALAAPLYKKLLERVIIIVKNVYRFLERVFIVLILQPIKYLIQVIILILGGMITVIWKALTFCFYLLFTPLKWIGRKVYSFMPKKFRIFFNYLAGFYSKIKNITIKYARIVWSKRR